MIWTAGQLLTSVLYALCCRSRVGNRTPGWCEPYGRIRSGAAGLLAGAVLAGCAPGVNPAAIADAQTAVRVKTALVNDADLGGRAIEVHVAQGLVTLIGRVRTREEAERAAALARSVDGVTGVQTNLQIGVEAPAADGPPPGTSLVNDPAELQAEPTLLAVGAAVGWSDPRAGGFLARLAISPLVKVGSARGFGPSVAFGWFQADLQSAAPRLQVLSRVHIRPVMVGIGYTVASERVSLSPSLAGGIAFNSLTITHTGVATGVAVEVDNSLVWRPGVSAWFDVSRRFALNVSAGYVMTRLRVTVLEGGRLTKQDARGDTAIVHAGVAYRLF